jgi:radical SAM protein with 4Fe4S-binding SPASM domain
MPPQSPSSALDSGWFARTIERRPQNLMWEITDACNLRCLHCEAAAGKKEHDELSHDEAMDVCDQIVAMGWEQVNITGGEPLLRQDWAEIAARLTAGGVMVHLVTNGDLFRGDVVAQAKAAGVRTIAVSLDGLAETHDAIRVRPGGKKEPSSFAAATGALVAARAAGFKTVAITHVNRWNFPELPAMQKLLREREIDAWQIQLGVPLGRLRQIDEPYLLPVERLPEMEEFAAQLIEEHTQTGLPPAIAIMHSLGYYGKNEMTIRRGFDNKRRFFVGCVGGWRALGLTSDGRVKPCPAMPREFLVGDVRREPLAAIWDDQSRFAYQSAWDENKLEGNCRHCQYRCICRAGCTAMAYALTGSIYNNPYCIYGQAMAEGRVGKSE